MKTKIITLLLALCALATTAQAQTYVTGATINNVNYRFYPDGTACVEPSPDAYGTINLVETLNYNSTTYTLTRIGDNAFHGLTTISSITIPNTVTHIGDDAFSGCSGITGTLTLPTALQHIGSNAFRGCTGLTGALNLPDGLLTIGSTAFYQCTGLTGQLNLPATLTSIGGSANLSVQKDTADLAKVPVMVMIAMSPIVTAQQTNASTLENYDRIEVLANSDEASESEYIVSPQQSEPISEVINPEKVHYKKRFRAEGKNYTMYYTDFIKAKESKKIGTIYFIPDDYRQTKVIDEFGDESTCPPILHHLIYHNIGEDKEFIGAYIYEIIDDHGVSIKRYREIRLPDEVANELTALGSGEREWEPPYGFKLIAVQSADLAPTECKKMIGKDW